VLQRNANYTHVYNSLMKCLTLTQPWASLIAIGAKRIETRSWRTAYRGTIAIHAAKGFPSDARYFAGCRLVNGLLVNAGYATADKNAGLPTGSVIATARLISCVPTRELQEGKIISVNSVAGRADFPLTEQEFSFGNYDPGRWVWLLADIKPLPRPVPAVGHPSLWDWDDGGI
jgi:hypothetical protein